MIYEITDWNSWNEAFANAGGENDLYLIKNNLDFTNYAGRVAILNTIRGRINGCGHAIQGFNDITIANDLYGTIENLIFTKLESNRSGIISGIHDGLIHVANNKSGAVKNIIFDSIYMKNLKNGINSGIISGTGCSEITGIKINDYKMDYAAGLGINNKNNSGILFAGRWDVSNCPINEISIRNSTIEGNQYVGAICAYHYYAASLNNIVLEKVTVNAAKEAGIIFGRTNSTVNMDSLIINNCNLTCTSNSSATRAAIISAYCSATAAYNINNALINCNVDIGDKVVKSGDLFAAETTNGIYNNVQVKSNTTFVYNQKTSILNHYNLKDLMFLKENGFNTDLFTISLIDGWPDITITFTKEEPEINSNAYIKVNGLWMLINNTYIKKNETWLTANINPIRRG